MSTVLKAESLSIGYDNIPVAENLNFQVEAGDYLCIVGENGSGKTTLMKTILSMQKPLAGKISFTPQIREEGVGYLPQHTDYQLDFPASVREIVLSGFQHKCGLRPFYSRQEKQLALENMKKLSVDSLADKSYRKLSGGQQQRVLLARALCASGQVLLLDEPVSGLDPKVTSDMYSLIEQLNKEGLTIIMISHDLQQALRYASHILHIGKNIYFGRKADYLNSESARGFVGRKGGEA